MSLKQSECIWQNVCLVHNTKADKKEGINKDNDEEDDITNNAEKEQGSSGKCDEEEEDVPHTHEVEPTWCHKACVILDHAMAASRRVCTGPGTLLSIKKMMKLFEDPSEQTHQMK